MDSGGNSGADRFDVATWEVGDWWLYTFSTPDYSDDTARIIDEEVERLITDHGYVPNKVTGSRGLITSFLNNVAHRANPAIEGYRDVINIRVKPTLVKPPEYINKKWTTSFESSGVVNKDPQKDWRTDIEL